MPVPALALVLLALLSAPGCQNRPVDSPPSAPTPRPASGEQADFPDPIYDAYDVFIVAGQSNAKGRGDAALSPEVPAGAAYEVTPRGDLVPLADPVGGANTGSAWPAFANAYAAATGRGVVIIGMANSGSAQVWIPGDTPNRVWDVGQDDNLYARADRKARLPLRVAEDELPGVRMAGWLWIQGGTDARRIEEGRITVDQYEAGLHALARQIGRDWGVPMYLFVSGTDAREDPPAAVELRRVQNEADALDEVVVVYRDAYTFPQRGWMQPDHIHWSQRGSTRPGPSAGGP